MRIDRETVAGLPMKIRWIKSKHSGEMLTQSGIEYWTLSILWKDKNEISLGKGDPSAEPESACTAQAEGERETCKYLDGLPKVFGLLRILKRIRADQHHVQSHSA